MTKALVSGLTVQAVLQASSGTGGTVGVSSLTTQIVWQSVPERLLISQIVAQILVKSGTSGRMAYTNVHGQVVYTIGIDDTPRERAWTMDFDGHTFYVLDMGDEGALVYDLTTQTWSRWTTAGYEGHFNFKNGYHWRAGKAVYGGSLLDGTVLKLNEEASLDEGFRPISYEIQGVIFSSSEDVVRQYNLRMVGSPGRRHLNDDIAPPVLNMVYSDDNGATWSDPRAVTLTSDTDQRIEFRSLGRIKQPGRIFRLYDSGGIKFIAYVMADVEGE